MSALLRGISWSNNGDFYCLNCFHSYSAHNKLKKHEKVCNNHDYCRVYMPKEQEKIKYLPREKSLKVPFIIYVDLKCLLKKVWSCQNNPENSYTEEKFKHKPLGYAWCSICQFDETKNRRFSYMRKDKATKEISIVFHDGSTYDYHFIIKQLAEEFEGEFECLG